MKRTLAAVLGAGLLLAGCGQNTPTATSPSGTQAAYGDGLDHSWTATAAEGQQLYAALSPGLKSQDFNVGLSVTATSGWGPIELNTSNGETPAGDGKPITLNGQVYSTGLGVHANSEIHVHATNLETPACTRFTADVGIDDEVGDKGSVVFQVFADGVKLFDSGVMTGASATQHIDVGIGNKSDLRFVVTDAGDNNYYDHADWAGATLSCSPATAKPSLTLDTDKLNIYHLHSNTLQATFSGYPAGPVQLRLIPDVIPVDSNGSSAPPKAPTIVLGTTAVNISGSQPQTQSLVFSAPETVYQRTRNQVPTGTFHLISSVNGVDVNNIPVTLTELRMNISAHFEPAVISGEVDSIQTLTLVTSIEPPLSGPAQIEAVENNFTNIRIVSSGPTTGTGGLMYTPVQIQIQNFGVGVKLANIVGTKIPGVSSGYRDEFYINSAVLEVTPLPKP